MSGDTSAAAVAKRKKLEEELANAREALEEKEYDRSISNQRDALNRQAQDFEDAKNKEIEELQETLEDRNMILYQSFEDVRLRADEIGIVIRDTAITHGIEVSNALTSAWDAGANAIATYGEVLNASSSQFLMNISGVEAGIYQLQTQANQTANALASMYSVSADNLVNELTQSYNAAWNMKAMTDALGQSLINTLDRGYAIDSITNMLNSAANAADNVASSANNAASALSNMASALANYNNQTVKSYNLAGQSGYEISKNQSWGKSAGNNSIINGVNLYDKRTGAVNGKAHAKGIARVDKDELAWTQENGQELIISPSDGSVLTRLDAGDAVFTAEQTKRLWELSKLSPTSAIKGISAPTSSLVTANTMQVGSLIEVNGNVNDSMAMLKIAAQEATKQIDSSFKQLSDGIHK